MFFLDDCCYLEFRKVDVMEGMCLMYYVIEIVEVVNEEFCGVLCFMEFSCVSYNFMMKGEIGKYKCELSNVIYK